MPESSLRFIPRELADGAWIRSLSAFRFFQNDGWTAAVFLLAGAACLLLALGYHRRLLYWFLIYISVSIKARYPLVLTGSDFECTWWVLWFSFFPWKEIDEAGPSGKTVVNASTRIFSAHLISFYFVAGLVKSGPAWSNGTAIQSTLLFDFLRNPGFDWLLNFPGFLAVTTYFVHWFEVFAAFALIWPPDFRKLRILTVGLFIGLHLALGAVFHTFSLAEFGIASWLLFLPGSVWPASVKLPNFFRAPENFWPNRWAVKLAYFLLIFELTAAVGNFLSLRNKAVIHEAVLLSTYLGMRPFWHFIAPDAPTATGWLVIRGVKADGLEVSVDPVQSRLIQPYSEEKPAFRTGYLRDRGWSRLYYNVTVSWYSAAAIDGLMNYACKNFPDLEKVEITGFWQNIIYGKLDPARRVPVAQQLCASARPVTYAPSQK